ncbi:hypothetical protein JGD43_25830, partial [Salmonella enterica subsp. enterica serovar Goldcoast]|nr:hypothetical protein [Salmonella enterica subsp. enterica serovar Goldcoast]
MWPSIACSPFPLARTRTLWVELVNLIPNSIIMLGVFVYLYEVYLGNPADLELFQYSYRMTR